VPLTHRGGHARFFLRSNILVLIWLTAILPNQRQLLSIWQSPKMQYGFLGVPKVLHQIKADQFWLNSEGSRCQNRRWNRLDALPVIFKARTRRGRALRLAKRGMALSFKWSARKSCRDVTYTACPPWSSFDAQMRRSREARLGKKPDHPFRSGFLRIRFG